MNKILKEHIGYWINRVRSSVHHEFENRLAEYGMSVAAWCILASVYEKSASSVNELANYIEVDKAAISRVLNKLVSKNLLCHKSGKDRRSGVISLTPKGLELIPLLIKESNSLEQKFFGHFTKDEKKILKDLISSVLIRATSIKPYGWLNN
jgi:DNA-binding MarR family transcriptional regulator